LETEITMESGYTLAQATAEAARCLLCHDAPCSGDCPATTDPGKFIRQLRMRNIKGAIATVKRNNALGGVCGALCPTCDMCQRACTATGIGGPIDIGGLQRFLVEYGWETGFAPLAAGESNGVSVAVVGAGPAGLSCAADLAQAGFAVTIFDRLDEPGGVPAHVIPAQRLSGEFIRREVQEILDLGVTFVGGREIASQADLQAIRDEGFAAIYLGTGAWSPTRLAVEGRDAEGVWDGIGFLTRARADHNGMLATVSGKTVAVIGGGDTAMDVALVASRLGAKDVYLLYRRSFPQMPANAEERQRLLNEGVHALILTQPVGYRVEDGRVVGIRAARTQLNHRAVRGRRRAEAIEGSEHDIPADLVIEAIGLRPEDGIRKLGAVRIDEGDRIQVDTATGRTAADRVYAGGDAVRGAARIAEAVGDGKRAAAAIADALGEEGVR
jgi:NADPH-dependent glutamate synthase beta subunit-like oxidoreductase